MTNNSILDIIARMKAECRIYILIRCLSSLPFINNRHAELLMSVVKLQGN